jgi:hypothetical protein
VVNRDLLANSGGLLVGDLLLGDRRTGRSIDIPYFSVIGLIVIAALIILANSDIVVYSRGGGVILFLLILNIRWRLSFIIALSLGDRLFITIGLGIIFWSVFGSGVASGFWERISINMANVLAENW